jgi:hypothetical protein
LDDGNYVDIWIVLENIVFCYLPPWQLLLFLNWVSYTFIYCRPKTDYDIHLSGMVAIVIASKSEDIVPLNLSTAYSNIGHK